MNTIIVTGGLGYIGSHICVLLLEAGYKVVIIDDLSNSNIQTLNSIKYLSRSEDVVFVELPKGLTAVVRSASLDGNTLWLINSDQEIEKNNVLGWQLKDNGIVLHYSSDFAGQLDVEIAPDSARLNRFNQLDINIHQVTRNNAQLDVEDAVVAQSNLTIKQNTQTDEE